MTGLQYPKHEKMQSSFWFGKPLRDVDLQGESKSSALWVCCRRRWTPTPHHGGCGRVSAGQRAAGVVSGPGIHFIRGVTATQCCSERRIRRKVGRLSSLHNGFLPWRFYLQTLTAWTDVTARTRLLFPISVQTAGDADSYDADVDGELLCIINANTHICESVHHW